MFEGEMPRSVLFVEWLVFGVALWFDASKIDLFIIFGLCMLVNAIYFYVYGLHDLFFRKKHHGSDDDPDDPEPDEMDFEDPEDSGSLLFIKSCYPGSWQPDTLHH